MMTSGPWTPKDTKKKIEQVAEDELLKNAEHGKPLILPELDPEKFKAPERELTKHQQWVLDTVNECIEKGYRPIPHFDKAPAPYGNQQWYSEENECWLKAKWVSIALDNSLLLDYDGNKSDNIISTDELAQKLGMDFETLAMRHSAQRNKTGDSLHFLFNRNCDIAGLKHSSDGVWQPNIDIKTGNQLMHIKPGKVLSLPDISDLGSAPDVLIKALKDSGHTGSEENSNYVEPEEAIRQIQTGENYHSNIRRLTARYASMGHKEPEIIGMVQGQLLAAQVKDKRWQERYDDVQRLVKSAMEKFSQVDLDEIEDESTLGEMEDLGFGQHLENLPGVLGEIQDLVYKAALYPSRSMAGFAALTCITALAQPKFTIDYAGGLALNNLIIVLAKTGYGKSKAVSRIVEIINKALEEVENNLPAGQIFINHEPNFIHKLHASQQKLHEELQGFTDKNAYFFSDEFAEWLAAAKNDSHKQGVVGYLMEAYEKALGGVISPPNSRAGDYQPIKNPRISILATTTGERLLEALTGSHGDSGFYNRIIFCPGDLKTPEKKYRGHDYSIDHSVIKKLSNIINHPATNMHIPDHVLDVWIDYDQKFFEKAKAINPVFGGRLGDQALKMAALVAISDGSFNQISERHMAIGCEIRNALYVRMAAYVDHHGGIGDSKLNKAIEQLAKAIEKYKKIPYSKLKKHSRQFAALDAKDQEFVIKTLTGRNLAIKVHGKHGGYAMVARGDG